jgi:hypothetical protein
MAVGVLVKAYGAVILLALLMLLAVKFDFNFHVFSVEAAKSFTISLWASIVFFTFIGVASFIIGIKRPQDELLEARLWYLFAGEHATTTSREYIKGEVRRMGAFSKSGSISIIVKSYDEDIDAYKVEFKNTFHLFNMFFDQDYKNDVDIEVYPDKVEKDVLGAVTSIVTQTGDDKLIRHLGEMGSEDITKESGKFARWVSINIERNGSASYGYDFWMYCKTEEDVVLEVNRYSEELDVYVSNAMQEDFEIVVKVDGKLDRKGVMVGKSKELKIAKGKTITADKSLDLCPGEKYNLHFLGKPVADKCDESHVDQA